MDLRLYCVYVHENQINGKVYVGMTCFPKKRFEGNGINYQGGKTRKQTRFGKAIEKYGWDSFSHEILWDDLTLSEAQRMERFLIDYYDSTNPKYGYNTFIGGGAHNKSFTK